MVMWAMMMPAGSLPARTIGVEVVFARVPSPSAERPAQQQTKKYAENQPSK